MLLNYSTMSNGQRIDRHIRAERLPTGDIQVFSFGSKLSATIMAGSEMTIGSLDLSTREIAFIVNCVV